ncbi:copper resistance protein CopZ [Lysinibacillus yapensis]|uniref:Copper chaperone CopZ n=1 Tax=Ureibacillus yapensis TaxID=2304605 RepID=A0A396S8T6_9BACL|nr:copper chaperone CopZ [Lysinibacillus yapensis]RHW37509.1 copper resistance protein CopZ [Lysinibacillus yapensis]
MENVTLNVKGMSCGHCVNAIEGSVGKLEGVEKVKVNLGAGQVDVSYNNEKVSLNEIKEAIDDQGYDVE